MSRDDNKLAALFPVPPVAPTDVEPRGGPDADRHAATLAAAAAVAPVPGNDEAMQEAKLRAELIAEIRSLDAMCLNEAMRGALEGGASALVLAVLLGGR